MVFIDSIAIQHLEFFDVCSFMLMLRRKVKKQNNYSAPTDHALNYVS